MTPYEHLVVKAEEIGWPAYYKNDLLVHDRAALEGRNPDVPFMWFVRETGTHLATSDGQGFKGEGDGIMRHVTSPFNSQHRGYLWNNGKLTEIDKDDFSKTYTKHVYGSGPVWKVSVVSRWRPAAWATEQKSRNTYMVNWSKDHDSLREYVYLRLPHFETHTIEIVSATPATQEVG